MEEQIKINNTKINSIIAEIIIELEKNKIQTIKFENGKPYISSIPRKILELEVKKIYMIYKAEFVDLLSDEDFENQEKINITSYLSDELDARGGGNEVTFSSGAAEFLSKLDIDCEIKEDKFKNLSESKKVENDLIVNDYINNAVLNKKQDIDFFLDALPHELMHCFGFKGGQIFEGVTETLTREIARKYDIRSMPCAHADETKLAQRIEKIIGRDNLSKYSYFPEGNVNTIQLSNCIDEKLKLKEKGILIDYENVNNEIFDIYKNKLDRLPLKELNEKSKKMYINLNNIYDEFIYKNKDDIYKLGDRNASLADDKSKAQNKKLKEVLEFQNKELEFIDYLYSTMINIRENKNDEIKKDVSNFELEK